jgi:hypothetical protein
LRQATASYRTTYASVVCQKEKEKRDRKQIQRNDSRELPIPGEGNRESDTGIPTKMNPKRSTPRHITFKLSKVKDKVGGTAQQQSTCLACMRPWV